MNNLLKEKEVCSILNISRTTLWRLKKIGLPSLKVRDSYRYDLAVVKNWMTSEQTRIYMPSKTLTNEDGLKNLNGTERIQNTYLISFEYLIQHNIKHLEKIFSKRNIEDLKNRLNTYSLDGLNNQHIVRIFSQEYLKIVRENYLLSSNNQELDLKLNNFINKEKNKIKVVWGDSYNFLKKLESESIQLMVTSPPYYNARDYSQWDNIEKYLNDMRKIIKESYRVLDNHRIWVFNVGDIFDNDNMVTNSVWGKKRIPLGAYFIRIFEEEGFEFVDDIIWDKGEVESKRHMNNGINYPLYQYPLNCYEHILIFHKHRLDKVKIPCPICGSLNVNGNTQSEIGVQSWECKNNKCFLRSPNNRGKRFSLRTNTMQYYHNNDAENLIEKSILKKWRRDIVEFPPVIKINHKGENTLGHTAPFPNDIPLMAIKYFSYVGEKILDPFAGSFTTPIVAKKFNRIGIGVEINKDLFRNSILRNFKSNFSNQLENSIYSEFDL